MTNEELEQKVKLLEEQLTEVRIELLERKTNKKPYEVELPEDIEKYYYADEIGELYIVKDIISSRAYKEIYQRGIPFKTKEEAQQFDEERILLFKLHKWAEEHNGGWIPNWADFDEEKWSVIYNNENKKFKTIKNYRYQEIIKLPYFKREDIAEQFIKEFGEEIIEVLY